MRRHLVFPACGPVIRFTLAVLGVLASSTAVPAKELGLFAKYDWINGAEDISGSRLRHDGVLDPGTVVSNDEHHGSGRVHLNRWDGVDLGYMPELNGAQEVLLRFEDVTEIHTGPVDKAAKYQNAVLAGGGDGGWNDVWCIEMETEYRDQWEVDLTFHVSSGETGWRLSTPSLTGPTLESVRYFGSMEFRFSAAAAEGEQLAIRWNDGEWVTGGEGTALEEFPSQLPEPWQSVRLNAGNRFDWDPMRADVGTVSFYSDRANVPEPSAVALLMFGAVVSIVSILWRCRGAYRHCPHWKGEKAMLRNLIAFPLLILVVLADSAHVRAATFELLGRFPNPGYPSSRAYAVSADGEAVVGRSARATSPSSAPAPFRWTRGEGMVEFAGLTGEERGSAYDVSADGSVVVGWIGRGVADMKDAFRWSHQEGVVLLPSLPEWTDYYKEARAVSADGSVVLGHCDPDSPDYYSYRLFRWTQGEGMVDMGPGAYPCISADGSVVVANDGEQGAFRWTEATGRVYLGALPGAILNAYAEDVSANGSVIVGSITYDPEPISKPFYWTPDEGLGLLFDPPGDIAEPTAISADGSMVVGWSDCYEGMGFVWDAVHGPRSLLRVLADEYGLDTSMFSTLMPHDVSADGRVIVGSGYRADGSGVEAWRAVIPEPSTSTLLITALATLVLLGRSTRNGVSRRSCSIGRSY